MIQTTLGFFAHLFCKCSITFDVVFSMITKYCKLIYSMLPPEKFTLHYLYKSMLGWKMYQYLGRVMS